MFRRLIIVTLAVAVSCSPAVAAVKRNAAGHKPAINKATSSKLSDFGVNLRPMTPAEADANAIWNLRAALNIAALQCQYSPFLATVKLYNSILLQHGPEIERAQATMLAHFKRYDGARATTSFDQYTTKTYNSYSTLDAQLAFCDGAATIGRELLTVRQGQLAPIARDRAAKVRASLVSVRPLSFLGNVDLQPIALPAI